MIVFHNAVKNALRTAERRKLAAFSAKDIAAIAAQALVRRRILSEASAAVELPYLIELSRDELQRKFGRPWRKLRKA